MVSSYEKWIGEKSMGANVNYQGLTPSDWIALTSVIVDVLAMLVGAFIAVWVVRSIQSKLDSEHKLREYFHSEILSVRDGYRKILDDIYHHTMRPKDFQQRMSSLSILSTDIMIHVKERYDIDDVRLVSFQLDLNEKISEESVFLAAYLPNNILEFPKTFEAELRQFEATNNSVFNEILVKLYKTT